MRLKNTFLLKFILGGLLCLAPVNAYVRSFDSNSSYEVYFTPTHNCTAEITRMIEKATHTLYVQAYFLTSEPIISALLEAKLRHVEVKVILDKNHPENQKGIKKMLEADIPVWIDHSSGIAHNKVMVIDEAQVITGSFNFSYSANHRNRENIIFIRDRQLAQDYLENWQRCQTRSKQEAPLHKKTRNPATKTVSELEKLLIAIARFVSTVLASIGVVIEGA